jgi:hypothetical protein
MPKIRYIGEEIAKLEEFYNFLHFEPFEYLFRVINYSFESGSGVY